MRDSGFGYRAKYFVAIADYLSETYKTHETMEAWLLGLRLKKSADKRSELIKLSGVGPKVADCVSLFSLDDYSQVPIDTHMIQLYENKYKQKKTSDYSVMNNFFKEKLGDHSGIVHTFLFTK